MSVSDSPHTLPVPTAGLTEPVLIRLDVDAKLNEQLKVRVPPCPFPGPGPGPVSQPSGPFSLQTSFFLVREDSKAAVLLHLLRSAVRPQDQTVVFVATKHHAEYLSEVSGP